jgi:putative endonuclease
MYRHNNSGSKSTKKSNDWQIVYTEAHPDKPSACKRELEIKKKKSRKYIEKLIDK